MVPFLGTVELMYPVVKAMLDEICEIAKQEMKGKKEDELGSWKRAVTTADEAGIAKMPCLALEII